MSPFHLAFPVHDLEAAKAFYAGILGCCIGRQSDHWVDFDFQGHQIVAHLSPEESPINARTETSTVDKVAVPVRHFGLVLDPQNWGEVVEKLKSANHPFLIEPRIRFKGKPGEQGTFFIEDPSGNALEFKYFEDQSALFSQ